MTILAAVASTGTAFNLVCSGLTFSYTNQSVADMKRAPFDLTFRVDLASLRYCMDGCTETLTIKQVTPNEIVLSDGPSSGSKLNTKKVNRESGSYQSLLVIEAPALQMAYYSTSNGTCKAAPFTGFPARKF